MKILRRLLGRHRQTDRTLVTLPVVVLVAPDGKEVTCLSRDISPTGLKLDISDAPNLSELTGGHRDIQMRILIDGEENPVRVASEPIWTDRQEDGKLFSGWLFGRY